MITLNLIKQAVGYAVGAGAGVIIHNVVKATTPRDISTYKKVIIALGAFAIAGIVIDKARESTDVKIDRFIGQIKTIVNADDLVIEEEA